MPPRGRSRAARTPVDRQLIRAVVLRALVVVPVAALLLIATVRSTFAEVLQAGQPAMALAWQPTNAGANAIMAHRLIAAGRLDDGRELASRAIARDPVEAAAYSAQGLAAYSAGDTPRAVLFMNLVHRMTRRERVAEIWLIRNAIATGNFPAAVDHFDTAMRSSTRSSADLMPLLVASTADPRMVRILRAAIARNPEWKREFLASLASLGPNPAHNVLLTRGQLDPADPDSRMTLQMLVRRLVDNGRPDLAWGVYREARPGMPDGALAMLRDRNYAGANGFAPFDWQLSDQPELTASRENRRGPGGDRPVLVLYADEGRTGEVARQLIRLRPGAHAIAFEVGAVPAMESDRPTVTVTCSTGARLLSVRPSAAGAGRVRAAFQVPGNCPWQWVGIGIANASGSPDPAWISNLTVVG